MRSTLFFVIGLSCGLAIWAITTWCTRENAVRSNRETSALAEEQAKSFLRIDAENDIIGAKTSIEDLFNGDAASLAIIQGANGIRIKSLLPSHGECELTPEEITLVKDALLTTYAYAPPCMCELKKEAEISFASPQGLRKYWIQYSGHPKIHAQDENSIKIDLSIAGLNLLLKVHDSHLPQDKVWQFIGH